MILFWEFWVVSVDVGGEIGDTGKSCLTSALQGLVRSEASMARWAGIFGIVLGVLEARSLSGLG